MRQEYLPYVENTPIDINVSLYLGEFPPKNKKDLFNFSYNDRMSKKSISRYSPFKSL
jgi:hypothetical protein